MTAERTLIDAMARDLWLEDARAWLAVARRLDGFGLPPDGDIDPAQYDEQADMPLSGPSFRAKWEGQARAALRSLHDHGPTPAMVEAGAKAIEETDLRDVWEGNPKGFYWAWMDCSSAAFKASLAAELEERQDHG